MSFDRPIRFATGLAKTFLCGILVRRTCFLQAVGVRHSFRPTVQSCLRVRDPDNAAFR